MGAPRRAGMNVQLSLRTQLAWVIALLSLLPNLVMAALVLLPAVREAGGMAARVTGSLILWLLAVVAFSAAIGYVLARVLLAPLTRVTRDAEALPTTAPRLAHARLATSEDDPPEVASLRAAINGLLAHVQREQRRRTAFTATLMHDMKTPLLAQANALRVLRETPDGLPGEERAQLLEAAEGETRTLLSLVQQLVDAHRFEQGEVRVRRRPVELRALVSEVAGRLEPQARERGVRIEVEGDARAEVDPDLCERMIGNLLQNAVRYASEVVRVEIRPGLFRVQDDGPGLPAPLEELARPFADPPAATDSSRYRVGMGGLGLYVARSILQAHGGRLVSEAQGPGGTVLLAYLGEGARA